MEAGPSAGPGTQSEDGGGVGATGRNDGPLYVIRASLVAQMVKSLPAMQETGVQSLDWEDPLAKGMAAHSCLLA